MQNADNNRMTVVLFIAKPLWKAWQISNSKGQMANTNRPTSTAAAVAQAKAS
jgi:hypothetical protein